MTLRDDINKYQKLLLVNKHRLDDELEIQADVQMRIGAMAATAEARMLEAKEDMGRMEARLLVDLRQEESLRKITKDEAEAAVTRHKDRIRLWEKYQEALVDHSMCSRLYDAWKARLTVMQTLARLHSDQYWTSDSVGPSRARRDEQQDEARAAMRRAHERVAHEKDDPDDQPRRRRVEA